MNLLLDTHVALWALVDSAQLSHETKDMINSANATIWISAVTVWEIAIKHGLGRGDMPIDGEQAVAWFREAGYRFLAVEPEHAAAVARLPAHHQDPFDRLLVAQALLEPMRLMTRDVQVLRYSDNFLPA
ncbi:MAG: type II toxin-antitoxin system VapC family toxin [Thermomonas sp.]|uniref:type II toxin-antitoxin system VapC family toxin n=1 Tax=Thermomonas sp. TaxID=1971895 RepID=UPI0025F6DC12|nr:type II toxin-antitoxin system VapC family toxin [Thermomonas sp.]MBK6924800.1 type II toxin-antitoxin system VapC family toxin [Thermomonas sp.]